ncbi:hypothetical protein ABT403_38510 [Streptomyces sp. NPDC000075]|uniref:hypothetical protein n=1 Tax=Streptomyces TaxID=1883 RepID=UPI0031CE957D
MDELLDCTAAAPTTLTGDYLGSDEHFATEHLKHLVFDYRDVFPREEVTDLEQHRTDLSADHA